MTRGILQRHAPGPLKRVIWDLEFRAGRWTCLDRPAGECSHPEVEHYAAGGHVLDLGCGPGSTGNELAPGTYASYTGVDISAVAVHRAQARAREAGREATNAYTQGDVITYVPSRTYDVIHFGDSIYYLPLVQIPAVLRRYAAYLTPTGHFIVQLSDQSGRYASMADLISSHLEVVHRSRIANEFGVPVETIVGHLRNDGCSARRFRVSGAAST
jgi:SAM-dependent methyltransferase